ncbi:MAG: tyrosine-type recombinase/integrase, partial [Pseudomonadota bacterium]
MRLSNYTLTPTRINNAKAKARLYKLSDGGGLFVEVSTTGQKTWRYQYRFAGSRRDVKIGRYPEIGVADARARHFELRSLLERGVDPAEVRRQETAERRQQAKDSQPAADQFEAFSRRWIRERLMTRSETYRNQIESRLERFVWPAIGEKPLGGVRPADVLAIIEDLRG